VGAAWALGLSARFSYQFRVQPFGLDAAWRGYSEQIAIEWKYSHSKANRSSIMCAQLSGSVVQVVVLMVVLVMISAPPASESAKLPERRYPAGVDFFEHEFTSVAEGSFHSKKCLKP